MTICDMCGANRIECDWKIHRYSILMKRLPEFSDDPGESSPITSRNLDEFDLCSGCSSVLSDALEKMVEKCIDKVDEQDENGEATQKGDAPPVPKPGPVKRPEDGWLISDPGTGTLISIMFRDEYLPGDLLQLSTGEVIELMSEEGTKEFRVKRGVSCGLISGPHTTPRPVMRHSESYDSERLRFRLIGNQRIDDTMKDR